MPPVASGGEVAPGVPATAQLLGSGGPPRETGAPPELVGEPRGYWDLVEIQFRKNLVAVVCTYAIILLFFLAAWAPVLANGKPFLWRKDGVTNYPLIQYMVAPSEVMSIDYVFNWLCFATITVPLALLARKLIIKEKAARKKAWWFWAIGLGVALIPFFDFTQPYFLRKWREDKTHYPELAANLNAAKGDKAIFTIVGQDPITPIRDLLKPPDAKNWLGTDNEGRDVLARMLHGARISLSVGFVAEGIAVLLGILMGALAGFYRGWVDIAISRFIEIVICFPTLFLILVIIAYIDPEKRSVFHIMIVIGLTSWTGIARLVRGEFLKLTELDFVQAARALGAPASRIMFKHILPNAMSPVLVSAAFGVAGAILVESTLSYLGFGAPPPTPTWGEMILQGKEHLEEAWWLLLYPGVSIFVTVTIYNLAGDGLRDAMDPKTR